MDSPRKGKRKGPHVAKASSCPRAKLPCITNGSSDTVTNEVDWSKYQWLSRRDQEEVLENVSWRMNIGTVYNFDGKWILFRHLTDEQWAAVDNNWQPNFLDNDGEWDSNMEKRVNFPYEETKVVSISPDDHDTKYIMSSAVILKEHYENGYNPPCEEINIALYLESKDFELDSEGSSFETDDSSKDGSMENLLLPLSHSAISELQGEVPIVCFDSDREGHEMHEWKEFELPKSKFRPVIVDAQKICVPRIEYTPNRKGGSRFWNFWDQDIEEESLNKEVCLTGCDHKSHKEWIHVDKIKKRYCFTDKGTRCKSWIDYRDYHKEREFMFNWLHPKQKEAKEKETDSSSCK